MLGGGVEGQEYVLFIGPEKNIIGGYIYLKAQLINMITNVKGFQNNLSMVKL